MKAGASRESVHRGPIPSRASSPTGQDIVTDKQFDALCVPAITFFRLRPDHEPCAGELGNLGRMLWVLALHQPSVPVNIEPIVNKGANQSWRSQHPQSPALTEQLTDLSPVTTGIQKA